MSLSNTLGRVWLHLGSRGVLSTVDSSQLLEPYITARVCEWQGCGRIFVVLRGSRKSVGKGRSRGKL